MRFHLGGVLLLVLLMIAGLTAADDSSCKLFAKEYVGKEFIAKEPLYDTVIGHEGIIKLERDKEEIRPGALCRVKKIECNSKRVEVVLKQVAGEKEFNKVEIRFRYLKPERQSPEGLADFRKMWAYVLEDVATDDNADLKSSYY